MTDKTNTFTALEQAEAQVWRDALMRNQGSLRRTCKELKKSRPFGLKMVQKYGLQRIRNNNKKYAWREVAK